MLPARPQFQNLPQQDQRNDRRSRFEIGFSEEAIYKIRRRLTRSDVNIFRLRWRIERPLSKSAAPQKSPGTASAHSIHLLTGQIAKRIRERSAAPPARTASSCRPVQGSCRRASHRFQRHAAQRARTRLIRNGFRMHRAGVLRARLGWFEVSLRQRRKFGQTTFAAEEVFLTLVSMRTRTFFGIYGHPANWIDGHTAGNRSVKVDPRPSWLSTSIAPFIRSTTCFTIEGPNLFHLPVLTVLYRCGRSARRFAAGPGKGCRHPCGMRSRPGDDR